MAGRARDQRIQRGLADRRRSVAEQRANGIVVGTGGQRVAHPRRQMRADGHRAGDAAGRHIGQQRQQILRRKQGRQPDDRLADRQCAVARQAEDQFARRGRHVLDHVRDGRAHPHGFVLDQLGQGGQRMGLHRQTVAEVQARDQGRQLARQQRAHPFVGIAGQQPVGAVGRGRVHCHGGAHRHRRVGRQFPQRLRRGIRRRP